MIDQKTPRLSRLIALLTHLQSKRGLTATEVSKKFGVSVRTVYRDIKVLEQAGVTIFVEKGKEYPLLVDYRLPTVMFTKNETNAFITAEKLVLLNKDDSLINDYGDGITKLKSVLRNGTKEKALLLSQRIAFWQGSNQMKLVICCYLSSSL